MKFSTGIGDDLWWVYRPKIYNTTGCWFVVALRLNLLFGCLVVVHTCTTWCCHHHSLLECGTRGTMELTDLVVYRVADKKWQY